MAKISEMAAPAALSGLELVPGLQGSINPGVPLLALGALPRGAVLVLRQRFQADTSSTAAADPGAGKVRWNNATQASATEVYVNNSDADANSISSVWAELNVGGFFYVQGKTGAARAKWQKWQVTAKSPQTGYCALTVTLQGSNDAFASAENMEVTLQQPTPSAGVDRNTVNALSISSGVVTVDCSLGDYFTLALTANVTGWTFSNVPPACSIMIEITQDSTARTVAWPTALKWAGGTAGSVSTASGAKDVLALSTFNGGSAYRSTLAKAFA